MPQRALRLLSAAPEAIREETVDGHEFLVVPVVALAEGVFQCANCPQAELYLAREFGRVIDAWNGRPVTLDHPKRNGEFVSAGSMDIRRTEVIGDIQNAHVDGDKLKVEAWIDLELVAQLGSRAEEQVARLEEGQNVEVSVGAFIDREPMVGSFNGRKFGAIQRNFVPDHLAILPADATGACSWQDGCGSPRVNRKKLAANCDGEEACSCNGPALAADQMGDRTRREMLRTALREKLASQFFSILQVFDDHVVFENERGETVKRMFTIDEGSGVVTLADDEEKGTLVSEFMPITVQKGSDPMDRTKAVDQLIANKAAPWGEDDRQFLMGAGDEQFAKLVGGDGDDDDDKGGAGGEGGDAGQATTTKPAAHAGTGDGDAAGDGDDKAKPGSTEPAASAAPTASSEPATVDDYVAAAPGPIQQILRDGVALYEQERTQLIEVLTANEHCTFSIAQLQAKDTGELRALVQLATPAKAAGASRQTDYRTRAPAAASKASSPFMDMPDTPKWPNQVN